ncbi:unnamed protein product [Penicillium olsonii]|nr:unnamed protein product [Penicillium olsonii]CAG7927650.1 unnamed protein product [Penicillium olsonii]
MTAASFRCSCPSVALKPIWVSPYHTLWGRRFIRPLAQTTTRFLQLPTIWQSNPKVFPGFELSLLTRENIQPARTYEPKAIYTYPAVGGGQDPPLNDRYHLVTRVGYGPTATVWLAIDLMNSERTELVVLKIYIVQHILTKFEKSLAPRKYPRSEYPYRKVLDQFEIEGPEGKHICVVHQEPGLDLSQMSKGEKVSLGEMRSSIRQHLIMMDYLHTDCQTTARVDPVKYKEAYPMADMESDELRTKLLPGDGIPLIIDYADADFIVGLVPKHGRSPEEILNSPLNYKIDSWAVAITAWDHVSSRNLINGRNEEGAFDDRVHIAELVALIGPPSPEFCKKMPLGSLLWDEKGQWTGQVPIPDRKLEDLASGEIDGEDLDGFLQWIRKALQWDPEDRPTALGLMRHGWMTRGTESEGA